MSAEELLGRWDAQQAAYIAHREQRFTVMLEVLELTLGDGFLALDLACGPGSLTRRLLDRFSGARVMGIDYDPLLLHVARDALSGYGDRLQLVDADLTSPDWPRALDGAAPEAVVSTTALHWLTPPQLVELYRRVGQLLAPGGILLNGDHLRFDGRSPTLQKIAAAHDAATQQTAFARGAQTWAEWWSSLTSDADLAPLAAERERRFDGRVGCPPTTLDFHLAALTQAGFSEIGTVWQYLDDYVVFARR